MRDQSRVKAVASALLASSDDLRTLLCPECGHQNLEPRIGRNSAAVICTAPIRRDDEMEDGFATCSYALLLQPTDITQGPFSLNFAEPTEKPKSTNAPAKKPAPRRRRTAN